MLRMNRIGARILKSTVSVFLCMFIYKYFRQDGIVFYSQLACLWCIQPLKESTMINALQRTKGTIVGALVGLIVLLLSRNEVVNDVIYMFIVSAGIIVCLYFTSNYKMKNASYFSCVVMLSIVINHITDENPYIFTFNRFLDTMIGIAIGILINSIRIPYRKNKDILFVSGLDDTLVSEENTLSDYSIIEINRMIEDGANFTISTIRTPASLLEPLRGVNLNLPVIAMDGAVLYDLKNNNYIHVYTISREMTEKLKELLESYNVGYFINELIDNTLIIQYNRLDNYAQKDIYEKLNSSPYRNYTSTDLSDKANCIYFMLILPNEEAKKIYEELITKEYANSLRIVFADSEYEDYSYIKIYNHNASRERMIEYLKADLKLEKTVTFGSIEGKYDIVLHEFDNNMVAKQLKKLYEPYIWKNVG